MTETVAADGRKIQIRAWEPPTDAVAVIQVLHGLGEHRNRYDRFAAATIQRGYAVCAHNHRGHGEDAEVFGHFADTNGWGAVVADARAVNEHLQALFADIPIVLLGHSMGSYVAQCYAMHYGDGLSGLILSSSTWPSRLKLIPAMALARLEARRHGRRGNSPLLDRLGFGNFNKAFLPARTELDWLSRDEAEVDKYVADPLCGGPYTCGLWLDVLGGLFEFASDAALSRISNRLPVLITGGEKDPVGGDKGMTKLLLHYAQTGHQRLTVKIYDGGRHEMLNETNRDQVTSDWLDWLDATT